MRGERIGGGILAAIILVAAVAAGAGGAGARADDGAAPPVRELDVVATSHLDTQWRWTIRQTIDEYIPNTLRDNFALFDRYPGYRFSFEGAFRYMLAREYYPEEYARLKSYIRDGRWHVAGSWVDAVDVNIPAPESLIRHALLGNGYHRREFGRTSRDVLLPDCFGFGFALPTIAAHCGLLGFSTQKLTWGSAYGVPFDVGLWEGVDGSTLVAALQPGDYVSRLTTDLSADTAVVAAIDRQGAASGLYRTMKYFGTGDVGGAPAESSVAWLERSLHGRGPVTVRSVASDRLARDLSALPEAARAKLPRYRGELLMTSHGAGCYTSQAAMKRWNRLNERLLDAAERAAVAADWLGASPWPREALGEAWVRFLWHQFHDDLTGTSIPEAYTYSWNDEAITQNRAAGLLGEAAGAVTRALDTRARGEAIVVYNPLSLAREDVVEAEIAWPGDAPAQVRVHGPDGREVPSQLLARAERSVRVAFLAAAPSVGFAVYDVRPAESACPLATGLAVDAAGSLENGRYRVTLDAAGDVASIHDKRLGRELLSAPLRLQILDDEPAKWAAWEIDYADLMAPPRAVVGGPARVRVAESGPARVALEVTRQAEGSTFVQRISLAAGAAGDLLTVAADIDWRTPGGLLKAAFPVATPGAEATYDLGVGVIRRGVNTEKLYEVPAQQWADLTGPDGAGVTVVNDCKYGWDHPDPGTLRLTLLHTPRVNANWTWVGDQGSQDLGHHRVAWGVAGHAGDWRAGGAPWLADRLNQPLRAFQAPRHAGRLGREFSLLRLEAGAPAARAAGAVPPVAVRAVKLAEESDEVVVRLQELGGEPVDGVRVVFARPVEAAREVNGAEEPLDGVVTIRDGALVCGLRPFQPRAFAVRLAAAPARLDPPVARPLGLPWNLDGVSDDAGRADGDFDGEGGTIAGELLPAVITVGAVPHHTGPRGPGQANVVACRGQRIALPPGRWDRLSLLAAAVGGDREAVFLVDGAPRALRILDHAEPFGQWDSRLVAGELRADPAQIAPGYVKTAPLAWVGTHRHDARGRNEAYAFTQVCRYVLDLPRGARQVTLPDDGRVRLLAATVTRGANDTARPASVLVESPPASTVAIRAERRGFIDSLAVSLASPNPGAVIRYTLDGADPGPGAPAYAGPLTLRASAVLKARAFAPGLDDRYVAVAAFTRMAPQAPAAAPPAAPAPGLACRLYEGSFERLPDFGALAAPRASVEPVVGLPAGAPREHFALAMDGWLRVPADGMYTFSLRTDDGSALALDGRPLIDADGLHGEGDARAEIALRAGWHPLGVRYFQAGYDSALKLWWEGPGFAWEPVPAAALAH